MENTLENRSKFFAQYFRQNILSIEFNNSIYNEVLKCIPYNWNGQENKCCLELKPLSSITDEDAIKLGYGNASHLLSNVNHNIDEIRGIGYALPFHGLSVERMIDFGWIKLKSE